MNTMHDLRPDSRAANALENTGAMGIFFGAIATIAIIPAWLEIGRLTPVIYWSAAISVSTLLISCALFNVGYRWNKRCYERWRRSSWTT